MTNSARVLAWLLGVGIGWGCWCPGEAVAATITVNTLVAEPATTNGNCSLIEAVMAANGDSSVDGCAAGTGSNDVIVLPAAGTIEFVAPATSVDWIGPLALPPLTEGVTIRGGHVRRGSGAAAMGFAYLTHPSGETVLFDGVHIEGFQADSGAAIRVGESRGVFGELSVIHCVLTDNTASSYGGAILVINSLLRVEGSRFEANQATSGGAIATTNVEGNTNTLYVSDSDFEDNTAKAGGGALMIGAGVPGGTAALLRATFRGNRSGIEDSFYGGGAVTSGAVSLSVTSCSFEDNDTGGNGGAGTFAAGGGRPPSRPARRQRRGASGGARPALKSALGRLSRMKAPVGRVIARTIA